MAVQRRWMIAAGVVLALGAVVFGVRLWQSERDREECPAEPSGNRAEIPVAPPPSAAAPASPSAPVNSETVSAEPDAEQAVGNGMVYGDFNLPPGAAPGLDVTVSLYRVSEDGATDSWTAKPGVAQKFSFDRLPPGGYSVYVDAPGYTAHASVSLRQVKNATAHCSLTLQPADRITGRVMNAAGEPVSDARIMVAATHLDGYPMMASRDLAVSSQCTTGPDGTFDMPRMRRSVNGQPGYKLAATADGFAPFVSDYIQAGTHNAEFRLGEGGVVSGRVVDAATGAPIPEAHLALESQYAFESIPVHADAEGYFFVGQVRPTVYVAVLKDDERVITADSATIPADKSVTEVELKVARGGSLSGRVAEVETGDGISGMPVTLIQLADLTTIGQTQTDATGAYRFTGLRTARYMVTVGDLPGFAAFEATGKTRRVDAQAGADMNGINFTARRGLRISGTVVDEAGAPLPLATIMAHQRGENVPTIAITSDARGEFVLAGFLEKREVTVFAYRDGYALLTSSVSGPIQLNQTDIAGVKFVMGIEATVSGIVVDAQGRPKRQILVNALDQADPPSYTKTAYTNADGSFTIMGLGPGQYRIRLSNEKLQSPQNQIPIVTLLRGQHLTGLRLAYPDLGGLKISGRVTTSQGQQVRDAQVSLASGEGIDAFTDAQGQFTVEEVPEGEQTLSVQSTGGSASLDVNAGDSGVVVTLKDHATVSGQVVDAFTNQPIPIFTVNGIHQIRDSDGRFEVTTYQEGNRRLRVNADGYAAVDIRIAPLRAGEIRRDQRVRLEPAVHLSGRVLNAAGEGIGNASVSATTPPGVSGTGEQIQYPSSRVTSAADGGFTLGPVPARPLTLVAKATNHQEASLSFTPAHGAANRADIVLKEGAAIAGQVTLDGKPVGYVEVAANVSGDRFETRSDAQGRYRIAGLIAGEYTVDAHLPYSIGGGRDKRVYTTLSDNQRATVNIAFISTTGSIGGRLYKTETESVGPGVFVQLHNSLPDGSIETQQMNTDKNGDYAFASVQAGTAQVDVYWNDTRRRVSVDIPAGAQVHKDFYLYQAKRLRVDITGEFGATAPEAVVMLYSGVVNMSSNEHEQNPESAENFLHRVLTENGVAEFEAINLGTYTVWVGAGDLSSSGEMRSITQVVEISETSPEIVTIRANL